MTEQSLTITQAAARAGVTMPTIAHWLAHPNLKYRLASHPCECGAHLLIRQNDLDNYQPQPRGRPAKEK